MKPHQPIHSKLAIMICLGMLVNPMVSYAKSSSNISMTTKQTTLTTDVTQSFPDTTFRTYLITNFDTNHDQILSLGEAEAITSINIANNQQISDLTGIAVLKNLKTLICSNTSIHALDVSQNKALETLSCFQNTNLTKLNVTGADALKLLTCDGTAITDIDISHNNAMKELTCYNNTNLIDLRVKGANALTNISCSNTGIKTLDVSENENLQYLFCGNTPLQSLDVSHNTKLKTLNCSHTTLAWLELGNHENLNVVNIENTSFSLAINDYTFLIQEQFPGIHPQHVELISGGTYDPTTGTVSNYQAGTDIVYQYQCGTSKNGAVLLQVTLKTQRQSSQLTIRKDLNKVFDGNAVTLETNDIEKAGSKNHVNIQWQKWDNNAWTTLTDAPIQVGQYRALADVEADNLFDEANTTQSFQITQAVNVWISTPTISDWTFKEPQNDPLAKSRFGSPIYTYSDAQQGVYQSVKPSTPGTWYVKTVVIGNENYTGLESIETFTIQKADTVVSITSSLDKIYDGVAVALTQNNIMIQGNQVPPVITWQKRIVDDARVDRWQTLLAAPYDAGVYKVVIRIQGNAYYRPLTMEHIFTISQAQNSWIQELNITGWTQGDTIILPSATAVYGNVNFAFSTSQTGPFTNQFPSKAGIWYVKATVDKTANYPGLESIRKFIITVPQKPSHPVNTGDSTSIIYAVLVTLVTGGLTLIFLRLQNRNKTKQHHDS